MKRWNIKGNGERIISEINITPLTDVMLVLLVIFMVTTPLFVMESFKIRLPTAVSADTQVDTGVTIAIAPGDIIYLNGKQVRMDELVRLLPERVATSKDRGVIIKADKTVYHGTVVKVLDIARRGGAVKLSIATEPEVE
ncbi:MAG: biopolymer transporter ExbD [Deltaproteobacteria bacterium]|nr:biopolymer transporter ExbD [Deltaproteobacteria bacterium]